MKELDKNIFFNLFREAYLKCFNFPLTSVLTEADSKLLSNKIFESTGLIIGAKSIKNYSFFVLNNEDRKENPSISTLDTLARYVLEAPYTDEIKRKAKEGHFPYWFQYRSKFSASVPVTKKSLPTLKMAGLICVVIITGIVCFFLINSLKERKSQKDFTDNFDSVSNDSLKSRGWIIKSVESSWWKRHDEKAGHLTLFTLQGDNWSSSDNSAVIKNLLMRKINSECFIVETHLSDFFPDHNWQQAGILISEDSTFNGKMIRLTISYNDFFGGYKRPPEIIIQAVSSSQSGMQSKPEEIAHFTVNTIEPGQESLVRNNLARTALKIEKKLNHFRFLYTTSPVESFAFKEVVSLDFDIKPKYASIFAIQGWSDTDETIPVYFDSFSSTTITCNK